MRVFYRVARGIAAALLVLSLGALCALAQSTSAGTLKGTVSDPSGAVIPGATVTLTNGMRQFSRTATTGAHGTFSFSNVPFGGYQLRVTMGAFAPSVREVNVRSILPMKFAVKLALPGSRQEVTVRGAGSITPTVGPSAQTNLNSSQLADLPVPSIGSGLSALITYSSPSVAADSNGMFHPLGDHAEQTYVIDGEPIHDQQSKLFSTSIPANAIQSMDLVTADPSAQYGDKTSMVIEATTRSGLASKPHGDITTNYGSFGTVGENAGFGAGNQRWGNYVVIDSVRSGRFLDTPEFQVLHDVGTNFTVFDRTDFVPDGRDSFHLDVTVARNNFQIPNTFTQNAAGQNQRQRVMSFNISPSYQHVYGPHALLSFNPWIRRDHVNYYPSANPFADTPATMSQSRYLTNWGGKLDFDLNLGRNDLTIGTRLMQTRLAENFHLGLTDPLFNAVCVDAAGNPIVAPGVTSPSNCASAGAGDAANPAFLPALLPYDLTRGGTQFAFNRQHNINEAAAYVQDSISLGRLQLDPGLRIDYYHGLVVYTGVEPHIGGSFKMPILGTVLRASYVRSYESPYNENLLLSSATGSGGLATNVFGGLASSPLQPGKRNTYDIGLQQQLGRYFQLDGDYFWKYTQNAFDFDVLFNTPLTFPITWNESKIDGVGLRLSSAQIHGFGVNVTLGHTRARYFPPENGGIIFNSPLDTQVFRIDHDQNFQQTTDLSYHFSHNLWTTLTWRYDSGLVAGSVPDLASVLALSGDQQAAIGFYCGSQVATLNNPITSCGLPYPQWGATRVVIPAPGTENPDTNPPRIAPRNLIDVGFGDDALLHTERGDMTLRVVVTNVTNAEALYNFLSTFSGTHFVSPRTVTATIGYEF